MRKEVVSSQESVVSSRGVSKRVVSSWLLLATFYWLLTPVCWGAWTFTGSGDIATEKTSDQTLALTYGAVSGEVQVVILATDNSTLVDGDNNEHTSITNNSGNTNSWTQACEYTNAQGSAAAGATVSIWYVVANSTTIDITFNLASPVTAKAAVEVEFSITAGNVVSVAGTCQQLANDGADPGSMTISGLTNQEYLFFRATGLERASGGTWTPTTNYSDTGAAGTTGGGAASNMSAHGEYRIFTGTGDTSNPTGTNVDNVSVYVALQETSPAAGNPGARRGMGRIQ